MARAINISSSDVERDCQAAEPKFDKCCGLIVKTNPKRMIATASSSATTANVVSVKGPRARYSFITATVAAGAVAVAIAARVGQHRAAF